MCHRALRQLAGPSGPTGVGRDDGSGSGRRHTVTFESNLACRPGGLGSELYRVDKAGAVCDCCRRWPRRRSCNPAFFDGLRRYSRLRAFRRMTDSVCAYRRLPTNGSSCPGVITYAGFGHLWKLPDHRLMDHCHIIEYHEAFGRPWKSEHPTEIPSIAAF